MPLIGTTQKSLHSTAIKVKKYIYNNNNIIIIIVKLQSSPSMGNYWNCYFWNKFCDFQATVFHIPFWSSVSWEWNIDSIINAECILISSLFHLIKWKASVSKKLNSYLQKIQWCFTFQIYFDMNSWIHLSSHAVKTNAITIRKGNWNLLTQQLLYVA